MVSGACERAVRAQRRGKRGAVGDTPGKSAADAVEAHAEAVGELDIIYLNPELVKAPGSCIDYVVAHELCHLIHGQHGPAFYALLSRAMPDWEQRKRRLEREGAEANAE